MFSGSSRRCLQNPPRLPWVSICPVSSGASSWLRITTNQTASFKAKGAAQAATAGALTSVSTTPHRLSARLEINTEAIAEVGTETFEAQLRSNLMMVLSNTLDRACFREVEAGIRSGGY